ncbi:hypothetical protein HN695_07915 [Candidatus Woesearchaeota archaeon]|jgi:hypothetical protein|nr:hypothetical protein [Candidatus Woesearchaeota archaeon]MBT5272467.1 hypothetical protein [Candidatus Woesearchaeota archaeon]MBT6041525.1 hypothetical protein [Candidatus Woesearchaeota archaeon]MBT6336329.1 hypothetical protein [Candidatus Woesearchaeota archaeon]MBT7928231.1 hypothetical protein [Candidatus Woesearchaeota archaeon]
MEDGVQPGPEPGLQTIETGAGNGSEYSTGTTGATIQTPARPAPTPAGIETAAEREMNNQEAERQLEDLLADEKAALTPIERQKVLETGKEEVARILGIEPIQEGQKGLLGYVANGIKSGINSLLGRTEEVVKVSPDEVLNLEAQELKEQIAQVRTDIVELEKSYLGNLTQQNGYIKKKMRARAAMDVANDRLEDLNDQKDNIQAEVTSGNLEKIDELTKVMTSVSVFKGKYNLAQQQFIIYKSRIKEYAGKVMEDESDLDGKRREYAGLEVKAGAITDNPIEYIDRAMRHEGNAETAKDSAKVYTDKLTQINGIKDQVRGSGLGEQPGLGLDTDDSSPSAYMSKNAQERLKQNNEFDDQMRKVIEKDDLDPFADTSYAAASVSPSKQH